MTRSTSHCAYGGLVAVCVGFAILGVALPWAYRSFAFAAYRDAVEHAIGDPGSAIDRARTLLLGITGGSIAGKWIAHLGLVDALIRRRARWAWRASMTGMLMWLVVDSSVSLAHGAWWNVVLINGAVPLLFGALLLRARTGLVEDGPGPHPDRALRWARLALLAGAGSGMFIAVCGTTPLFGPWHGPFDALTADAASRPAARALLASVLGPIGGSTLAQFVMLAALVRHAGARERGRTLAWCAASILTWAVYDSAWSFAVGAAFNVALVNAPALVLTAAPLAWAAWWR